MSWGDQVFNYCERGLDPAFWAEPLNAATNAAFLLAAWAGVARLRRAWPSLPAGERAWLVVLVSLVAAIGVGSFLFHTFATRWALLADVLPITLFMVAYLTYALRSFLGLGWLPVAVIIPAFLATGSAAGDIDCAVGTAADAVREPCLNGSLGYAPALIALVVVGLVAQRRFPKARLLLWAAAVFLVSMTLRTLDRDLCAGTLLFGAERGTHAFWHILNGVTLYLLLSAVLARHETASTRTAD